MNDFSAYKQSLSERLHALIHPLSLFKESFSEDGLVATDGLTLYYPQGALSEFLLLHETIHCLFGHPFQKEPFSSGVSEILSSGFFSSWDICCDLAALEIARRWLPEVFPSAFADTFHELSFLIPERIFYRPELLMEYLSVSSAEEVLTPTERERLTECLKKLVPLLPVDDHSRWPVRSPLLPAGRSYATGDGGQASQKEDPSELSSAERSWEYLRKTFASSGRPLSPRSMDPKLRKKKGLGNSQENRRAAVQLTDRKRHDYRDLLLELSDWREELSLSKNEFHYASYLYGMEELKGIPLIEPLEYEETKKIHELAIVIDTSGSCSGPLVQAFLEETRNLMEEAELFSHPFELHILQCDNKVRRDDRITSGEEFASYIEVLEVEGMGGTDFRPAFAYIEELKSRGLFSRLQGILYFTDGQGRYPTTPPEDRTVFLFLKDHYDTIELPDWAETLVLEL